MREPGFYWVKRFDKWSIAEFDGESWTSTTYIDPIFDRDWQEIDERRIVRDDRIQVSLGRYVNNPDSITNDRDKEIESKCNAIIELLKNS
jgi:hypothetical protein